MASALRVGRAVGVLVVVLLGASGAGWLAAPVVVDAGSDLAARGGDPATVVASSVTLTAAAALALVACWVATATTWCVVSALLAAGPSRAARAHPLLRPWLVRALVGAALGTTALAGPAAAATGSSPPVPPVPTPGAAASGDPAAPDRRAGRLPLPRALAGLPLPDRPTGAAPPPGSAPEPAAAPSSTRSTPSAVEPAPKSPPRPDSGPGPGPAPVPGPVPAPRPGSVHTVTTGESLWSIAADHLPPGAPPAAVDRWWRALYDANRPGIGDDPDLIRPGTVLRLPRPLV